MVILTLIKALGMKEIDVEIIVDTNLVQLPVMICHQKMGKINNMEQWEGEEGGIFREINRVEVTTIGGIKYPILIKITLQKRAYFSQGISMRYASLDRALQIRILVERVLQIRDSLVNTIMEITHPQKQKKF